MGKTPAVITNVLPLIISLVLKLRLTTATCANQRFLLEIYSGNSMDFAALYRAEKAKAREQLLRNSTFATTDKTTLNDTPSSKARVIIMNDCGYGVSYCNDFLNISEATHLVQSIDDLPQENWANLTQRRLLNLGGVPHPSGSWAEPLPQLLLSAGLGEVITRLQNLGIFNDYVSQHSGAHDNHYNEATGTASANHSKHWHVLLNEYNGGQGIDPHNDGPLFAPTACIVSLGGDAVLHFYDPSTNNSSSADSTVNIQSHENGMVIAPLMSTSVASSSRSSYLKPVLSVILQDRSLVVFTGEAYGKFYHGIDNGDVDVVTPIVANGAQSGVVVGDYIRRSSRRLSLTVRLLSRVERVYDAGVDFASAELLYERERRRQWWLSSISEK